MLKQMPTGAQLLVLPINRTVVTAGYKNAAYERQMGFPHYGVDSYSEAGDATVYAMGEGTVVAAGLDGTDGDYSGMGWVTVIRYNGVYLPAMDRVQDLVATTFHHQAGSLRVKEGDRVTKDTVIGRYGNTGGTTVGGKRMGIHLHLQLDVDVAHPLHCYGISGRTSRILKGGTVDSTLNPFQVLTRKDSSPDRQTIILQSAGWAEDWSKLTRYEDLLAQESTPSGSDAACELRVQQAQVEAARLRKALEQETQRADDATVRLQQLLTALEQLVAR